MKAPSEHQGMGLLGLALVLCGSILCVKGVVYLGGTALVMGIGMVACAALFLGMEGAEDEE